ncbi:Ig-like domain-containing protein [Pendulispora rubella]|uniref:Ig-like domain-containing protein n=1 Tax=Pendulispora rubella TaxID=2741070 RepID=A0ABZ2L1Z9_9BACT
MRPGSAHTSRGIKSPKLATDAPPATSTAPLFTFNGGDDIAFGANRYDKGFNQRVSTANMPASEVTLRGDDLALNADKLSSAPVSVTYTSSDPSVATVDSHSVVTGLREGPAVIIARATIGGDRVRSNPLAVSVADRKGCYHEARPADSSRRSRARARNARPVIVNEVLTDDPRA